MPPSDLQPMTYPALWFTSRTPTVEGQTRCSYARWLGYHAGPHGTGWRRRANHVPLATGSAVHEGLELLGQWLKDADKAPSAEVIAWAATEAASHYEQQARHKGLILTMGDVDAASAYEQLIMEQRTLVEGLIWVWALVRLPALLGDYRVIDIEAEETIVLDCTCGLGEAICDWQLHATRKCRGIVQMGRADWLMEQRQTGEIIYIEFKTKASANFGWERAWEHSGQLLVNMEAASRRLGKSVSSAVIDVLYKGRRDKPKTAGPDVPKTQQSPLCYAIYEPGGLGAGGTWRPRKDREYWSNTVPLWDETLPMMPVRDGASRVESFVTGNISSLGSLIQVLGPFPRPQAMVEQAIKSILATERRWRVDVEDIRNGQDPELLIERSYQCTGFDGSPCAYQPICFGQPDALAGFEPRVPHHTTEKEAVEASGVRFADDEASDDDAA